MIYLEKLLNILIRANLLKYFGIIILKLPFFNKIKKKGNNNLIINKGSLIINSKIEIYGSNNTIKIGKLSRIKNMRIVIHGDNNNVDIDDKVYINDLGLCMDFNDNNFSIGKNTIINNQSHFSCMEGTSIIIGSDCLFSSNIIIRTCDSHSIVDHFGKRLNKSKNILIGNHVWVGANVTFLKGAEVSENSVVAINSIITKKFTTTGCILAGIPAKVVKCDINWDKYLIK